MQALQAITLLLCSYMNSRTLEPMRQLKLEDSEGAESVISEHFPGDEMLLVPWCQFQLCPSIHCLLCLFDFFYILYFLYHLYWVVTYHSIWHVLENIHLRRLRQIPPLEK